MDIKLSAKLEELGIEIEEIGEQAAQDMVSAVQSLAASTYQKAVEMTGDRLHTTRQTYINALHMSEEGSGIYVVYLDPSANHLEEGMDGFNMLPKLATGPKSKMAKDGSRYVTIPFRNTTAPANPNSSKQKDLAQRLKDEIKTREFKKVKEGVSTKTGKYTTVERMVSGQTTHPYLKGLTRVRQYNSQESAQQGEPPASSSYFTFRVASTKQDPTKSWVHPGTNGANIFPELADWAETEMEQIIVDLVL